MSFGMGPYGEMYYDLPYSYPQYGGYSPYYGGYAPYFPGWDYPTREQEKAMLEEQIRVLEEQLKGFKERLVELKKSGEQQTPQQEDYWRQMQPGQPPYTHYGPGAPFYHPGFQPPPRPVITPEDEVNMLNSQAQFLKQQLDFIDARVKELEKES